MVGVRFGDGKKFRCAFFLRRLERLHRADIHAGAGGRDDEHGFRCAHGFRDAALKVEKAGRVNDIELGVVPFDRRHGGGYGGLAPFFLCVKVEHGVAVCHTPEPVGRPRDIQHRFAKRGLALAAVPDDGNVADMFGRIGFHKNASCFKIPAAIYYIKTITISTSMRKL